MRFVIGNNIDALQTIRNEYAIILPLAINITCPSFQLYYDALTREIS